MEKLIEFFGNRLSAEQIREAVINQGYNPDELDNKTIATLSRLIDGELNGTAAIQVSQPSKPTKGKRKQQQNSKQNAGNALTALATEVEQELQAIGSQAGSAIDGYVAFRSQQVADDLVEKVGNAPHVMLDAIAEAAKEYRADPEYFRTLTADVFGRAFPIGSSHAAEPLDSQG